MFEYDASGFLCIVFAAIVDLVSHSPNGMFATPWSSTAGTPGLAQHVLNVEEHCKALCVWQNHATMPPVAPQHKFSQHSTATWHCCVTRLLEGPINTPCR